MCLLTAFAVLRLSDKFDDLENTGILFLSKLLIAFTV